MIASVSVATTTRPISAARARRQTWMIIGSPAMSTIGLPGEPRRLHARRDDDQRARHGFVALFVAPGARRSSCGSLHRKRLDPRLSRVARRGRIPLDGLAFGLRRAGPTALSGTRAAVSSGALARRRQRQGGAMIDSFEFSKIAGAVLSALLVIFGPQTTSTSGRKAITRRRRALRCRRRAEQPSPPRAAARLLGRRAGGLRCGRSRRHDRHGQAAERPADLQEVPHLPYGEQGGGQQGSDRTCGTSSAARRPAARTSAATPRP